MAIKPLAQRITCRQCGWTTLYTSSSDALIEHPPDTCQQCSSQALSYTPAGIIENTLSLMFSLLKK